MSVTPDLPEDVVRRLTTEAQRRGATLADVVPDVAAQLLPAGQPLRHLAFVGAGASAASGITQRTDQLLDDGFGRD